MTFSKESFNSFWDDVIRKNFPDAKIRYKNEVWWMKYILRYLLFFNPSFMTDYITVLGKTVYFPSEKWVENARAYTLIEICAHEMQHMWDSRVDRLFSIKYLFPQILAIFSVLSIFAVLNTWFLLFLIFLFFVVPLPAPWRVNYEARGYAMSMHWSRIRIGPQYNPTNDIAYYSRKFTDGSYYWMEWRRQQAIDQISKYYETLPKTHAAFKEVTEWLTTQQK